MGQPKYTIYKYVRLKDGSWRYCRAALYANHTIKADVALTHELWMRRSSPTISGVSLRGFRNGMILATGCPPKGERHWSVSCGREKLHSCQGRRYQKDVSELARVGEKQRSEHPCSALGDRAQVPTATRPPFLNGFAPTPEFAPDEVVGEDRPKRASPGRSPEEYLTADWVAYHPERREREDRRGDDQRDQDEEPLQQEVQEPLQLRSPFLWHQRDV